jgi:3-deoxy-D-manno-octulosonate 8-phosphate phosphatase (KDO 8-P phosphatase)
MPLTPEHFTERARPLRLLLFDVDGVLTDGSIGLDGDGRESKLFFIRDGAALVWARRAGLDLGLLSGRRSPVTLRRAEELGIRIVEQEGPDKLAGYSRILAAGGYQDREVAFMGDDLHDLPVLRRAGLSAAPADAAAEVRERVHWVSACRGGAGAVREFVEAVLRARESWDGLLAGYLA